MMTEGSSTTSTGDKPKAILVSKHRYESKAYVIEEKGLKHIKPIVIANWEKFRSENDRSPYLESKNLKQQAEKAVARLKSKFGIEEGEIQKLYNLDKKRLMEELRKEGKAISERASPDVFICFIIARGLDNFFYDVQTDDGNSSKIYFREVMEIFNGTNCPGLVLRPKLFFTQTECHPSPKKDPSLFKKCGTKKPKVPDPTIPVEADFLLYSLTSPDFPEHPLKFIDFVCDELEVKQDILLATVTINKKVRDATEEDMKGECKAYEIQEKLPLCTSQLTKDIIL